MIEVTEKQLYNIIFEDVMQTDVCVCVWGGGMFSAKSKCLKLYTVFRKKKFKSEQTNDQTQFTGTISKHASKVINDSQ